MNPQQTPEVTMTPTADTGNNNNTDHYEQLNVTNDDNTINYTNIQQPSTPAAGIDTGNNDYEPVDYEPVDTLNGIADPPAYHDIEANRPNMTAL